VQKIFLKIKNMTIEVLFEKSLKKQLQHLETKRKTIFIFYIVAIAIFLGGIAAMVYYFGTYQGAEAKDHAGEIFLSFLGPLILGFSLIGLGNKRVPAYKKEYKKEVVEKIAHSIDPGWEYDSKAHVMEEVYYESKLFNKSFTHFYGDDKVSGRVGKTVFESSELNVGSYQSYHDSDGESRTKWAGVFKGYFFHAAFNKQLQGETYVVNGDLESVADTFRSTSSNTMGKRKGSNVALENKEFAKAFMVRSTSQTEARYILTPKLMESLLNIYKLFKRPMHMSFLDGKVYLAILFYKDLMEPTIWKSGVNIKELNKLYQLLNLNKTIIEELDLNTRIWTKD
jgi:hypothetical protein